MRTVLAIALTAALAGCIPEGSEETGADAGLATTTDELVTLCTTPVTFTPPTSPTVATLVRSGIHYVSGSLTDVEFNLPACPWVSGVTVDGVALGTTPGIENASYYQIVSDTPVAGGHRVRVRLWLSNPRNGARKNVLIWANNSFRDGAVSLPITWVGVDAINRTSKVSIPTEQLKSNFASATYRRFGDDGRERDEDGVPTGWHSFDYQGLSLTVDDSIRFHASQKYRVYSTPFNCDVTATVDGRFRISRVDDPDNAGHKKFQIDWVKPSVSHPLPFLVTLSDNNFCTLGIADVVVGFVAFIESVVLDDVQGALGKGIAGGIGCDALFAGRTCADITQRFEYAPGELRAVVDPVFFQVDGGVSITVKAPYGISGWGVASSQLVLPANSTVLITQEGLVNACFIDNGSPATCNGSAPRKIGAAGLFNLSDKATWPVPDPYEYGSPPIPQRVQALAAHVGLNRSAGLVPAISHDAGALLGRHGLHRSDLGSPCVLHTDLLPGAPPVTVSLGRNDRALNGTPYGSGTALVTAYFTINAPTGCPDFGTETTPPNPN